MKLCNERKRSVAIRCFSRIREIANMRQHCERPITFSFLKRRTSLLGQDTAALHSRLKVKLGTIGRFTNRVKDTRQANYLSCMI